MGSTHGGGDLRLPYVEEEGFVFICEVASPDEFDLQHLDELEDGGLWIDGDEHVLFETFPFFLFVEEQDHREFST